MTQYSITAQTNKVYDDTKDADFTILVARGCLCIHRNDIRSVIILNSADVVRCETYLEIIAQKIQDSNDGTSEEITSQSLGYLSFSSEADLEACYSELSKWTNRTIESACDISENMIGRGVQGAVFHGTSRQGTNDGMAVAVKKIREDGDVEVYTNVYLEEHENVLVALDILRDDNFTYIVMPYLEEAETLKDFLDRKMANNSKLKRKTAKLYMSQILSGVAHLHATGISHTDIHFNNIMVQHHLNKVTIIDFGFAIFVPTFQKRDIRRCGNVLARMTKAGRRDKKARTLIFLLLGDGVTAAEALNHAWFKPAFISRIFRRTHRT